MARLDRYYVAGHTAKGFVNYLTSNIKDIKQIITLTHSSKSLKTRILNNLLHKYEGESDVEIILSPFGKEYIEGVIFSDLSLGFITDSIASEKVDATVFKLEEFFPSSRESIVQAISRNYMESYEHFSQALSIHDELEAVYINEMDFTKADKLAEEFLEESLGDFQVSSNPTVQKLRLFGTNTPEGQVNIVPELLDRVNSRYYLKGRAGTGKSTFMRSVIKRCEELGLDMEIYLCSFDPNSVDMVLVPEADFCIFDSTAPHEFFPEREQDSIIDLYEQTVKGGTDERFASEINRITKKYKSEIKLAMKCLKEAGKKQTHFEKEHIFSEAEVDQMTKAILETVKKQ